MNLNFAPCLFADDTFDGEIAIRKRYGLPPLKCKCAACAGAVDTNQLAVDNEPVDPLEEMQWEAEEELHRSRGRYMRRQRVGPIPK